MSKLKEIAPVIDAIAKNAGTFVKDHKKEISFSAGTIGLLIGQHYYDEKRKDKAVTEARKEAYEEASRMYEQKFGQLENKFLEMKAKHEEIVEEYETLLNAYDTEITNLQAKLDKSEAEKTLLNIITDKRSKLIELQGCA